MCVRASILSLKFDIFPRLNYILFLFEVRFCFVSFSFSFNLFHLEHHSIQTIFTYDNILKCTHTARTHPLRLRPTNLERRRWLKNKISIYHTRHTYTHNTHSITRFVFRCQKKRIKSIKSAEDDDHDEAGGGGGERKRDRERKRTVNTVNTVSNVEQSEQRQPSLFYFRISLTSCICLFRISWVRFKSRDKMMCQIVVLLCIFFFFILCCCCLSVWCRAVSHGMHFSLGICTRFLHFVVVVVIAVSVCCSFTSPSPSSSSSFLRFYHWQCTKVNRENLDENQTILAKLCACVRVCVYVYVYVNCFYQMSIVEFVFVYTLSILEHQQIHTHMGYRTTFCFFSFFSSLVRNGVCNPNHYQMSEQRGGYAL